MFRLLAIAFFLLQAILLFSFVIWAAGKVGFGPAEHYAMQIENFARPVWDSIISQF
jgi:hypothetical protein